MKVLILNHPYEVCGVHQFAKRIFEIVEESNRVEYEYCIVGSLEQYRYALEISRPDYALINYHWDRLPWLSPDEILSHKELRHYFIYHDGSMMPVYDKYLFFGDFDPNRTATPPHKRALLPRPLLKYNGDYPQNKVFTVGSFGFVARYKRFPELVRLVNRVRQKAIINLHITRPYYGDRPGASFMELAMQCQREVTKPEIKLNIQSEFIDEQGLLRFLAGNDINVFYYDDQPNPGISSAPDYALSVKRPIAITRVKMLRHIYTRDIIIDKHNLMSIWQKGTRPLEKFYHEWSRPNFIKAMDDLFLRG